MRVSTWRSRSRLGLVATALLTGVLGLSGCQQAIEDPAFARLAPPDARLAAIYERSCANCHEAAGTGAPRRGDLGAWARRETTGLDALVASVRQGKGTMPPMGWCPECADEDFKVLVGHLRRSTP